MVASNESVWTEHNGWIQNFSAILRYGMKPMTNNCHCLESKAKMLIHKVNGT